MDEIALTVKGIRPLKMQVYFTDTYLNMDQKVRSFSLSQRVTTCIIRRNGLILGAGVSVCHPNDKHDPAIGRREAFKAAAKVAGWKIVCKFMIADGGYNPRSKVANHLYSAWRKALREQAEAEKA